MPVIELRTHVEADVETVFNLSLNVDLHKISTAKTNEKAIAGRTSGLMQFGETVTWKAKHFGIYHVLTTKITAYEKPAFFIDEQVKGIFNYFKHTHSFLPTAQGTKMTDVFEYKSPLGSLGKLADVLFLKRYMTSFLTKRNTVIKEFAESEKWKAIL